MVSFEENNFILHLITDVVVLYLVDVYIPSVYFFSKIACMVYTLCMYIRMPTRTPPLKDSLTMPMLVTLAS